MIKIFSNLQSFFHRITVPQQDKRTILPAAHSRFSQQKSPRELSLKSFVGKSLKWVDTRLKPADLSPVPSQHFPTNLEERQAIAKNVKVGDTIFLELTGKPDEYIEYGIVFMQKFSRIFKRTPSHSFNNTNTDHVSIVVGVDEQKGEILISECMPAKGEKVRTVSFFKSEARVHEDAAYKYHIFRPKDPTCHTIALRAAEVGSRLGIKHKSLLGEDEVQSLPPATSPFSFMKAIYSMLSNGFKFKRKEQAQVFRSIFEEATKAQVSMRGKKPRKFFCSMFVAHVYQQAEAAQAWEKMIQEKPELKSSLDDLIANTRNASVKKQAQLVSKWSQAMAKREGAFLARQMRFFKLNSDKISPAGFYNHLEKNSIMTKVLTLLTPLS
ncbi:MAG: hypothetical protein CK425_02520 [Parachlamydia sp.]|nr:MAG: hypothetical protein CK425_02520 [Parachlamydia sp.]